MGCVVFWHYFHLLCNFLFKGEKMRILIPYIPKCLLYLINHSLLIRLMMLLECWICIRPLVMFILAYMLSRGFPQCYVCLTIRLYINCFVNLLYNHNNTTSSICMTPKRVHPHQNSVSGVSESKVSCNGRIGCKSAIMSIYTYYIAETFCWLNFNSKWICWGTLYHSVRVFIHLLLIGLGNIASLSP